MLEAGERQQAINGGRPTHDAQPVVARAGLRQGRRRVELVRRGQVELSGDSQPDVAITAVDEHAACRGLGRRVTTYTVRCRQSMRGASYRAHTRETGDDAPDIRDWRWPGVPA